MATGNSKTRRVLRLSRHEYRLLAEETKAAGMCLNLSTFKIMGCWGTYSPWALLVCKDASSPTPGWCEHALITLAASVDANQLRAAGTTRPEVDWSVLEDHEIYPFIVQHEIGHRNHNFDSWGMHGKIEDTATLDECRRRITFVNEVLADRYAWEKIRPGEPIPLSETGRRMQEKTAASLAYMTEHCPIIPPCKEEWKRTPGQYCDVPEYMLATLERAAFIGPAVHPHVLKRAVKHHSKYREENGYRLYLGEKRPGSIW